eukprot:scaffold650592_cov31-Prasinocladus_malaysianus.AAC.1
MDHIILLILLKRKALYLPPHIDARQISAQRMNGELGLHWLGLATTGTHQVAEQADVLDELA